MRKNIIIKPLVSEKSTALATQGWYSFRAPVGLNKKEAAEIVENNFKVKVVAVNSQTRQGKKRKSGKGFAMTKSFKKFLVKLKKGDKLNIFEVET